MFFNVALSDELTRYDDAAQIRTHLSKIIDEEFGTEREAVARLEWLMRYSSDPLSWNDLEYIYLWLDKVRVSHQLVNSVLSEIITKRARPH